MKTRAREGARARREHSAAERRRIIAAKIRAGEPLWRLQQEFRAADDELLEIAAEAKGGGEL